jgi:threonine dehydrogenase-like Zn-dependent dehydrogenase
MADGLPGNKNNPAKFSLPPLIRRWHLSGAGLESLEQVIVVMPKFSPDELLVRHEAVGICFSDIKIITQGPNHARLQGRDLKKNPVVMGHEVALTVVGVGANLHEYFEIGQRFIIQADVYFRGENPCYGYQLDGGMAEYGVVTQEVLQGDEGVYLLPLSDQTGFAEAALVEPWACVVASYEYPNYRDGLLDGGRLLVANGHSSLREPSLPIGLGHQPATIETIRDFDTTDWAALRGGFDDVLVYGTPDAHTLENLTSCLGKRGVLNLIWDCPIPDPISVDVGRVHYEQHLLIGTNDPTTAGEAYKTNQRQDLQPGGTAWFVGAGGPMGQMHLQRAIMLDAPPKTIVVSDRHQDRLDRADARFSALANQRQITLHLLNVENSDDSARYGPFDDIISMVPDAQLIADSLPHLAPNGVFNVFAGLGKGTLASIDLGSMLAKNQRLIGTSGSSLADLRHTLELVETGLLSTNSSLAAIGGLNAFREGLAAVQAGRFPGKTVIYPNLPTLPLMSIAEIQAQRPNVFAKMQDGQFWTNEAEQELLRDYLSPEG